MPSPSALTSTGCSISRAESGEHPPWCLRQMAAGAQHECNCMKTVTGAGMLAQAQTRRQNR
eukprot:2469597-Lingulodinium_polyedra.AAC.1